jgi:hypothetical protein
MWAYLVVLAHPSIEIGLQLVDGTIYLFSERDAVKFVEHRRVKPLTDAVGLLVLMPLRVQYSLPRSVNVRSSLTSWLLKNGST